MDALKVIEEIREAFSKELETKTGWGRVEVKAAFERAVLAAVMKLACKE